MKLLLIIAVVVGVLWVLRGARSQTGPSSRPASEARRPTAPPSSNQPVPTVSCAFCGLHLPRDEAFFSPSGEHFCSEAHRIEHIRQDSPASKREHR